MTRDHLLKHAYALLEQQEYRQFIATLDDLAGRFDDTPTVTFLMSARQKFFQHMNSLFDDLDAFLGRDYSALIPARRDEFEVHQKITGFDYPKTYHANAIKYLSIHTAFSGLTPESKVLELGCGAGNFAYALTQLLTRGCYYGIDTSRQNIASCQSRFATLPTYKFHHIDAALSSYHFLLERSATSTGARVEDVRLPLLHDYFSLQVSHSVFTHMYTDQVRNYLEQLYRSLQPGGVATNTCFIIDGHSREQIRLGKATHLFVHEKDGFFWYWPHDPLMGNAFAVDLLLSLYEEAGFQIRTPILYGTWANRDGPFYQDIVVAVKPL